MKNKGTAVILCLFLGGLGIHKFYLGSNLLGLLYLIFCWTFIPFILAFIDFFILIFTSDKNFNKKYNAPFIRKKATEDFRNYIKNKHKVAVEDFRNGLKTIHNITTKAKNLGVKAIKDECAKFHELGNNAPILYGKSKYDTLPAHHINKIRDKLTSDILNYSDNFKRGAIWTSVAQPIMNLITTMGQRGGLKPKNVTELVQYFCEYLTDLEIKVMFQRGLIDKNDIDYIGLHLLEGYTDYNFFGSINPLFLSSAYDTRDGSLIGDIDKDYITGVKDFFYKRLDKIINKASANPIKLKRQLKKARKTYNEVQELLEPLDLSESKNATNYANKLLNSKINTIQTYLPTLLNSEDRVQNDVFKQLYSKDGRVRKLITNYGDKEDKKDIENLDSAIKSNYFLASMFKSVKGGEEHFSLKILENRKNTFAFLNGNLTKDEINFFRNKFDEYRKFINPNDVVEDYEFLLVY